MKAEPLVTIPPMTDPLGVHWKQPDPSRFAIDDKVALMTKEDLLQLSEYSHSIPSGVYVGKCWRAKAGDKWLLCWFGPSGRKESCTMHTRFIELV